MGPMVDCYVLSNVRTAAQARLFLERFLPERRELAAVYEIPYMTEQPSGSFISADDLMAYLESNPEQRYVIYWVSTDGGLVSYAIVAPTADGAMILGLSCEDNSDEVVEALCRQLKEFTGAEDCLAELEMPPPASAKEFFELLRDDSGQG
ncbi:hypothetical protein [Sorangium sp. So ce1024]|uniref:hypothetical protein n=1 Tax=Sorangium sp. So ce1024 TaxID=3133327 RepID=UPI003F085138